ncbi:MAG: hypothetical protein M1823_000452 [Watsoniomyces obsoletus]|nr:MAG: hypothetical protein M1823_000452 [Watsoniomyces obsoletus]
MRDPLLTSKGENQSRKLQNTFPYHADTDLLVSSPIRRALYTTLLGFEEETKRGVKVLAFPDIQETSDLPCDTPLDLEDLRKEFDEDGKVDFSLITDESNVKTGRYGPTIEAIEARAKAARQWFKKRPEKTIVVVTHGGFLHYFTEDWADSNKFPGTGWANTEFRSYRFEDAAPGQQQDDNASLVETEESRQRRRGTEKPLTNTEKMELRETKGKS